MVRLIDADLLKDRLKWGWTNDKFVLRQIDEMPVTELHPYGGYIGWEMQKVPEQVVYAEVAKKMLESGVLAIEMMRNPTSTLCYWEVKAVKLDED